MERVVKKRSKNEHPLKKLRLDSGLKQRELANILGITQGYVSKLEKGVMEMDVIVLYRLSSYFIHLNVRKYLCDTIKWSN